MLCQEVMSLESVARASISPEMWERIFNPMLWQEPNGAQINATQ